MTEWSLVYDDYRPQQEGLREALCALGNGYFVTRGAGPESVADDVHYPGTYLAGGWNRLTTEIAGREIENEDLVNLPNWLPLKIRLGDGHWLSPDRAEVLDYRQELDLEQGLLTRRLVLREPEQERRTVRLEERRLVSMANPHLAALELRVVVDGWSGQVTARSELDGTVINDGVARYRDLAGRHLETVATSETDGHTICIRSRFVQSRLEVVLAARTRLARNGEDLAPPQRVDQLSDLIAQELSLELAAGDELKIEKVVTLFTSRDAAVSEPGFAALLSIARAPGFDRLLEAHRLAWRHLWQECGVGLEVGDEGETLMKLRLHIFHLLQTVCYHSVDQDVGVPPRGWHGEAYRGHIFWDELFILPFLNFRIPVLTRALLRYRHRRLDAARHAAREAGFKGAMFPWQSGSDGREESQKVHLNPKSGRWIPDDTHRQRHIGAAIAYNVWHYHEVTADYEFLYFYSAELLFEIARFWASIAELNPATRRYEIRGVMGPDEFHTAYPYADPAKGGGLNNNAYTNVMAAWILMRALDVRDLMPRDRREQVCERIGLADEEFDRWDEVSRRLVVPFHGDGVISQFEGYAELEEFDWHGYREKYGDIHRLDRLLESEGDTPNRYQASKQADVLMLFYLFSSDELALLFERLGYRLERDTIPKTIDYYLARTSHGSTLSWVVHSWVLARALRERSWPMFCEALDSDIADIQGGTTPEGIHLGAMAGTVDMIQRGYTGIEPRAGVLHFNPCLPQTVERLTMRIRYRRVILEVEIDQETLTISSRRFTAEPVTVSYRGHVREMSPGERYTFRLIRPEWHGADKPHTRDVRTAGTD